MNHEHAITLLKNGYISEAIRLLTQATALNPQDQDAIVNLCIAQESLHQYQKAEAGYRWVLSRFPKNIEAASNLANLLARSSRLAEASQLHASILGRLPQDLFSLYSLAQLQCDQARIEDAIAHLKKISDTVNDPRATSEYLSYCNHIGYDEQGHRDWVDKFAKPLFKTPPALPYDGRRQIRVGYVSNTWDRHSVSAFILPILRSHSKAVAITLYSDIDFPGELFDETAERRFVSTRGLNFHSWGNRVRQDEIDVLVDLDGHKKGGRLLSFASKPAPVMGTLNGYLPDTFLTRNFNLGWAFEPHADAPEPSLLPFDRNGFITFGSFHRTHKITLKVASTWGKVIQNVPDSRLQVTCEGGESNSSVRERLVSCGVPTDRLSLVPQHASTGGYLKALGDIDVHMDSWPFNGVSVTCDLLYQGVPTVSMRTSEKQGQAGESILRSVGLDDLVAGGEEEFVMKTGLLSACLGRLRSLRASLRGEMKALNGKALTAKLEGKYREALLEPREKVKAGKPCNKCQRQRAKSIT